MDLAGKKVNKTINIYLPSFDKGGVSKITINIINYFIKKNRRVLLFSQNAKKSLFVNSKKLKIITIKRNLLSKLFPNIFNPFFVALELCRHLKSNNKILSMQSHFFLILLNLFNNNKIIIRNSEEIIGATKYSDNKINGLIVFFLKIIFYQFTYKIIALSKLSKDSLKKITLNKKKISLIYNPYISKIKKFKKKKIKNNKFHIVTTGRLTKQKNFELLIKTVIKLKKLKNISLTIIGNGNREKIIKKMTINKNYIKLINWRKDLSPFYNKANLYVLPSLYEGSPNVLLDSINYSTPILASNCSGVKDLIGKNRGYIFKINDEIDLEKKIIYIINNYNEALQKSKNAYQNLQNYTIKNSKHYLDLIENEKKI